MINNCFISYINDSNPPEENSPKKRYLIRKSKKNYVSMCLFHGPYIYIAQVVSAEDTLTCPGPAPTARASTFPPTNPSSSPCSTRAGRPPSSRSRRNCSLCPTTRTAGPSSGPEPTSSSATPVTRSQTAIRTCLTATTDR